MGSRPSIEEGIRAGKGAQRRLTLIPQKISEWCMDSSGYHPTTRGGQERLRLQVEADIKRQMFSDHTWVSDLRDLDAASDWLEESIKRMLRIDASREETVL